MAEILDDPELPQRIRARDPEALRTVVETYLGQIFRAARGAGLPSDAAEDVTQATFTTFLVKAESFEGRSHVRTWLFGILYRKIAEARRGTSRDNRMDDIDEVMEERFAKDGRWSRPPHPVDAELENRETRERIQSCLEGLPERLRLVFVLREVEELPSQEICKILEISRTNYGVMMYRVRNRLRECLEAMGLKGRRDAEM